LVLVHVIGHFFFIELIYYSDPALEETIAFVQFIKDPIDLHLVILFIDELD